MYLKQIKNYFYPSLPRLKMSLKATQTFVWHEVFLGVLLIGLLGYGLNECWQLNQVVKGVQKKTISFNANKRQIKSIVTVDVKGAEALSLAVFKLNYPWDRAFKALEKARTPNVSILEILPNSQKNSFEITAQTISIKSMLDYIKTLRGVPFVSKVVLDGEETQQEKNQPIIFKITMSWY